MEMGEMTMRKLLITMVLLLPLVLAAVDQVTLRRSLSDYWIKVL